MLDLNEKIMQCKGAIIDFNIWRRDKLLKKIEKQERKLNDKNERIEKSIHKWLDGWSDALNRDGYRTKDNNLVDLNAMIDGVKF